MAQLSNDATQSDVGSSDVFVFILLLLFVYRSHGVALTMHNKIRKGLVKRTDFLYFLKMTMGYQKG